MAGWVGGCLPFFEALAEDAASPCDQRETIAINITVVSLRSGGNINFEK